MLEITMTPSSWILLAIIAACTTLAIRRLIKRGMCDCGDHRDDGGICAHCKKHCASSKDCSAISDMLARMDKAADNIS